MKKNNMSPLVLFYENFDMNFDVKGDTLSCMMILFLSIATNYNHQDDKYTAAQKRKCIAGCR
jgi:hypothetical protein